MGKCRTGFLVKGRSTEVKNMHIQNVDEIVEHNLYSNCVQKEKRKKGMERFLTFVAHPAVHSEHKHSLLISYSLRFVILKV